MGQRIVSMVRESTLGSVFVCWALLRIFMISLHGYTAEFIRGLCAISFQRGGVFVILKKWQRNSALPPDTCESIV